MAVENLFWTAFTSLQRQIAIDRTRTIISQHGDLVDFRFFSDLSVVLTVEIPEARLDALYKALQSTLILDYFEALHSASQRERTLFINVSFPAGTGDLKVEVPSVPG
jgi:hypothetical protein